MKQKLPILKISDFVLKGAPLKTPGSTYPGVPHLRYNSSSLVAKQARPRSDIHIFNYVLSITKILSGLISLCIIFFLCIKSAASNN